MKTHIFSILATLLFFGCTLALDNGLGFKPAMGWNSWNAFNCDITEAIVKSNADALVTLGLSKVGYVYVNIDDCWQLVDRDADGHVQVDKAKFPSGMKALSDYIHQKGLKFGLYSSAGTNTCQGRAASLGHEVIDAKDYALWGVDYLKYDNCYNNRMPNYPRYIAMRDALNATGRPIYFSLCNWGEEDVWKWGNTVGNSWRTTGDILANWDSMKARFLKN